MFAFGRQCRSEIESPTGKRARRLTVMVGLLVVIAAVPLEAQPSFTKQFIPDTIGPGSTSELRFTITNGSGAPVTDLAFVDNLPAGVVVASPGAPTTDCLTPTLVADDGTGSITLSGASVAGSTSCTISVYVTAAAPGTFMNVSGDLTSSAGNSGTATDDLTVATNRPGFSKNFSPATVDLGERSTLTFSINNSLNSAAGFNLAFQDNLPAGVVVASPSNAGTTCSNLVVNAVAGSQSVSVSQVSFGTSGVAAGASCSVSVDVVAISAGLQTNVSENLTSGDVIFTANNSSGLAVAQLQVDANALLLTKSFVDDPSFSGSTVTLEFTVANLDRVFPATMISFTDDLDAVLTGLVATGLPLNDVCGAGSTLSGTSVLSLANGSLSADTSCTFSVTLQIPPDTLPGGYVNTTSAVSATVDGAPQVGNAATETLFIVDVPLLTKTFLQDPVGAGDTVDLEFTITSTSVKSLANEISFTDNLSQFLGGAIVTSLPAAGFCGAGSLLTTFLDSGDLTLLMLGGSLAPGDSCTFTVGLLVPANAPAATYTNTTSALTADVAGDPQVGQAATDTLTVVGAPRLFKTFTDDPVLPGGTVTLEFTVDNSSETAGPVSAITFTDDLNATVAGLAAVGLPLNDICGTGSSISGTTNLTFAGGILAAGETCTFSVTLQVPASALPGEFTNTTSNLMATSSGQTAIAGGATAILQIAGLRLTKEFIDDPVIAGETVTLRFTIDNQSGTSDATGIFFTDQVNASLPGLAAVAPLPTDPCGTGSTISGTTSLVFAGGSVLAGASCSFDVTVQVPAGAASNDYLNNTSSMFASIGGNNAVLPPAADTLSVNSTQLMLTKEFTDDPVIPGGMVTLELGVMNLDTANGATNISLTDDLDAALTGLVAVGLPLSDVCGAGSTISGTSLLTLTGGNLPPGGSCTVPVTLQVPASASLGSTPINTTSQATGTVGGLAVTGDPASDTLILQSLTFSKAFDGPTVAGGTAVLNFTIQNTSATELATGLSVTDDLDAVLPGLVATGLPQTDTCGVGSAVSGTSFLALTNGSLLPLGSCTIMVPVQVPPTATPGSFLNTTSDLTTSGLFAAPSASASLTIEPPPTFSKSFAPGVIPLSDTTTLLFTIDNSASAISASSLDFTDNLPAGSLVAATPNASTTCTGGTVTAVAGTGVISYSGGGVSAGGVCTVSVDVQATALGTLVNTTGDLTSSNGNSGTASDSLTVVPPPTFDKTFAPNPSAIGAVSTLTFTIDNSASVLAVTGIAFVDTFPAGLQVATPSGAATTCTGGTLTAVSGSSVVSYSGGSVAGGASCTVSVDTTPTTSGQLVNTSGNLTSSSGNSGTATDTLDVVPPPTFSKAFAPDPTVIAGVSTLTFTIDNSASSLPASALDFTDNLPAGLEVAAPANASTTCTGGTVTAAAGAGTVSYTGGMVAAGATCTVAADVTPTTSGQFVNTTGDLTSSNGNSGTASDTLTVNPPPVFSKSFTPTAIDSGSASSLVFTIDNTASTAAASALDFTDVMPTELSVATPANAATTCTGGTLTAVAGTGTISYVGGTVAAASSCTVTVDVTGSLGGSYVNTSGALTSSLGDSGTATATLIINLNILELTKSFVPTAVQEGGTSTVTLTFGNPGNTVDVANVAVVDNLPAGLTIASTPNASTTCPTGTVTAAAGSTSVSFTGGTVAAGATCTASFDVVAGSTVGDAVNTTNDLTSEAGTTPGASATLSVLGPIVLTAAFASEPVLPGGIVDIDFTVTNPSATRILGSTSFSIDLGAALAGMTAIGLPVTDVCGAGSTLSGATVVTLSDGVLAGGATCAFSVTVAVPPTATPQQVTAATSTVNGVLAGILTRAGSPRLGPIGGIALVGPAAQASFQIAFVDFTKLFDPDAVDGGTTTDLVFDISNPDPVNAIGSLSFTDDLDAVLPGLVAQGLPLTDVCGAGSSIDGTSTLTFTGGSLAAGATCTFAVSVAVPVTAQSGIYPNVTSALTGQVRDQTVDGGPASASTDELIVNANVIGIPTLDWSALLLLFALLAAAGVTVLRRS